MENIRRKFGVFNYSPFRTPYTPNSQYQMLLDPANPSAGTAKVDKQEKVKLNFDMTASPKILMSKPVLGAGTGRRISLSDTPGSPMSTKSPTPRCTRAPTWSRTPRRRPPPATSAPARSPWTSWTRAQVSRGSRPARTWARARVPCGGLGWPRGKGCGQDAEPQPATTSPPEGEGGLTLTQRLLDPQRQPQIPGHWWVSVSGGRSFARAPSP